MLTPGYTFSAYRVAEKALRKIGAFPITDSAADPLEMREALDWLTIIMAELAGRDRVFWLTPATLPGSPTATGSRPGPAPPPSKPPPERSCATACPAPGTGG